MTAALAILAVTLLTDPTVLLNEEGSAAVSADADRFLAGGDRGARKSLRITSRQTDFDRQEGVLLFEGNVAVDYGGEFTMCAERVYVFLSGSNELSRVVSLGGVAITNGLKSGRCEMATYRRRRNEIEMFAGTSGAPAHLEDREDGTNVLEGSRIRFWLDSEQVEVEQTALEVEKKKAKEASR